MKPYIIIFAKIKSYLFFYLYNLFDKIEFFVSSTDLFKSSPYL